MSDPSPATVHLVGVEATTWLERLGAGSVTTAELTAAYLARIAEVDAGGPRLASVVAVAPDAAEHAERLDAERRAGRLRGPLHGLPVLVKDNCDTTDLPTTAGSLALADGRPARDATVVARLRAAGALVLGKTNLSEWANFRSTHSASGWSAVGGLTGNPHALDRSAGGSSSGSGAAMAASLAALTVGTETDGSIMCPATNNGVVGVKPTVGLVSRAGIVPISASQDTAGPLARSVRDAALLLTVLAGPDDRDGGTATAPYPLADLLGGLDGDGLRGARLGVARTRFWGRHAGTDAVGERALGVLAAAGAALVDPADIPTAEALADFVDEMVVLTHEFKAGLEAYLAGRPDSPVRTLADVLAFNREHAEAELAWFDQDILETSAELPTLEDPSYREALERNRRHAGPEGIDAALDAADADALVMPTCGPAWKSDLLLGDPDVGGSWQPAAAAGYPSVSVPMGFVHGLPVGLSFVGRRWSEPLLLRLAHAFERALLLDATPAWAPPRAGR